MTVLDIDNALIKLDRSSWGNNLCAYENPVYFKNVYSKW